MDLPSFADKIANGIETTLEEGKVRTKDVGGNNSTSEYINEIISNINKQ